MSTRGLSPLILSTLVAMNLHLPLQSFAVMRGGDDGRGHPDSPKSPSSTTKPIPTSEHLLYADLSELIEGVTTPVPALAEGIELNQAAAYGCYELIQRADSMDLAKKIYHRCFLDTLVENPFRRLAQAYSVLIEKELSTYAQTAGLSGNLSGHMDILRPIFGHLLLMRWALQLDLVDFPAAELRTVDINQWFEKFDQDNPQLRNRVSEGGLKNLYSLVDIKLAVIESTIFEDYVLDLGLIRDRIGLISPEKPNFNYLRTVRDSGDLIGFNLLSGRVRTDCNTPFTRQ